MKIDPNRGGHIVKDDHLDLIPQRGDPRFVKLVPEMSSSQLRTRVESLKLGPLKSVHLHCVDQHWDRYSELIREAWPHATFLEGEPTPVGSQRVPVHYVLQVSPAYWQAVAKVGFHYFLATSRRGYTGAEDDFNDFRDFIMNGVGAIEYFFPFGLGTVRVPAALNDPARSGLNGWTHRLILDERGPQATVAIALFVSPDGEAASLHKLAMPAFRSRLLAPGLQSGRVFQYYAAADEQGYAGHVLDVESD